MLTYFVKYNNHSVHMGMQDVNLLLVCVIITGMKLTIPNDVKATAYCTLVRTRNRKSTT